MASYTTRRKKWSSQRPQLVSYAPLVAASTPRRQREEIRQRLHTPIKPDALSWSPQRLNHITYVSFGLTPRAVGPKKGGRSSASSKGLSRTQQKATCLFPSPQEVPALGEDSRDADEGADSLLCVELPSSPSCVPRNSPSTATPDSDVEGQLEQGRQGSQELVEVPLSRQAETDTTSPLRQETSADAKKSLRRRPPPTSGEIKNLKSSSSPKSHPRRSESLDPPALPPSLMHLPYPIGRFSSGGKKSRPCRRHALKRLGARTTTMACRTCQVALCLDCFAAYHLETLAETQ